MLSHDVIHDWNTANKTRATPPKMVELCDETLRDGLQSPSVKDPPIEAKLKLLKLMDQLGITIANIGLPGAGPRAVHDVTKLAEFARDERLAIKLNCAARTVIQDIEPIAQIQQKVGIPIAAYCFVGTSPIRQYAEDWDFTRLLKVCDDAISFAIKNNLEVAFVTEDTTRSHPDTLEKLFRHAISLGARRLVLCDTVGHATPEGVGQLVDWTLKLIQSTGEQVGLDWHGHNDRGLALYNALYAAQCGCDRIHGTALGVGERVGNTSMDQLIVNLKLHNAYPHDVHHLTDYIQTAAQACGVEVPYNYPVFGHDAFRTATGVHAAAVVKAHRKNDIKLMDTVYSSVPASWFGKEQVIEIGPMSGLSNIRHWLEKRGIKHTEDVVEKVFNLAKSSDHVLSEQEIIMLI